MLRHRHLASYVIGAVEFAGAEPGEAVLVSVPPYHVAGLANLLSNLYLGRRIVYSRSSTPRGGSRRCGARASPTPWWCPTMLARICDVLEADGSGLPTLQALSYGRARAPATVLHRVMALLPDVQAHQRLRAHRGPARRSRCSGPTTTGPPAARPVASARLSSAGQVLPTVEVEGPRPARRSAPRPASPARSGCRASRCRASTQAGEPRWAAAGWFPTRDRGWIDDDGYLFIEGRSDDTIIRGGENIAPAEIEEVLLRHPNIRLMRGRGRARRRVGPAHVAAVVVPRAGAALDAAEVREFARRSLRGSKTPDAVTFAEALPFTETGKLLLLQVVQADLLATP